MTKDQDQFTDEAIRYLRMAETSEDGNPVSSVKDEFLASLVGVFGESKGLQLFQTGEVSDKDLTALVALLDKFGLPGLAPPETETAKMSDPPQEAPPTDPSEPEKEKEPEINMSKTVNSLNQRFDHMEKQITKVLSVINMHNNPITEPPKPEPPKKPALKCRADGQPLAFQPARKD